MATNKVKITLDIDTEELRAMRYYLGRRYGEGRFRDQALWAVKEATAREAGTMVKAVETDPRPVTKEEGDGS